MLGLGMGLHKHKQKQIVRNGLVLYLDGKDFSNSPPTSLWNDRSGLGNNATPSGMAYTTSSGSDGVGGVVFDGVDDYVDCGNKPVFDFTGEFTLEYKMKQINTATGWEWLICKNIDSNSTQGYMLAVDGGKALRFAAGGSGVTVALTPQSNTMYHIFGVYKPSQYLKLVVNGVTTTKLTSPSSIIPDATNPLTIGRTMYYVSTYFNHVSKLARVYNRALTDTEILQNYNASR